MLLEDGIAQFLDVFFVQGVLRWVVKMVSVTRLRVVGLILPGGIDGFGNVGVSRGRRRLERGETPRLR